MLSSALLLAVKEPLSLISLDLKIPGQVTELGPELFMRLFSKVSSEKLIRFLSDQGRVSDYLAVILALPSGVFIKSAYQLAMKP